ncbi:MAG: ribonuclease III domain-containing protein [Bacillota bacterium]
MTGLPVEHSLKPEGLPVPVLAYLGDAVYGLFIRRHLIGRGLVRIDQLHKETVRYVRADFQARAMRSLAGSLNETEEAIARRGRNAKSTHPPRGAKPENYRYSTALEALVGYLYLKGEHQRLAEIMELILEAGG